MPDQFLFNLARENSKRDPAEKRRSRRPFSPRTAALKTDGYESGQSNKSPSHPFFSNIPTLVPEEAAHPVDREQATEINAYFRSKNVARACIRQLQRYLNDQGASVRETGWLDLETARALYDEAPDVGGRVDERFFESRGLFYFEEGQDLVPPGFEALQEAHPDGLTLSFYANYSDPDEGNSAEFLRRANDHASQYQSLGFVPGSGDLSAALGMATPIEDVSQLPQYINQLANSVRQQFEEFMRSMGIGGIGVGFSRLPKWCFVKNVALFSHGMHYGMSLNAGNSYARGLGDERRPGSAPSNIRGFVDSVSDLLSNDVSVQLFACNTAKNDPQSDPGNEWALPEWGDQGGHQSFAANLNSELEGAGKNSTVYGHNMLGHVTSLSAARIFGAEAGNALGQEGQSLHPFEVAFPRHFVDAELQRLSGSFADEASIRRRMWDFYRPILREQSGNVGGQLFTDLHTTTDLIRHRWIKRYPG
jgi:hypothetical protein